METMIAQTENTTHQIWSELKTSLRGFIARRIDNEADADDILQNVFLSIHSRIHQLKDTGKVHAWVYQITRNAIYDYYRSRRPEISLDKSESFDIAQEETPEAENERQEILSCLNPMIDRLPDNYRRALRLADIQEIPQAEVANQLNISVSGAKSRVQRARGKVKNMLLDCCQFEFDRLGRAVGINGKGCSSC
jgi:RNA polymerase sigma-70 factor (ECF subfamily)